MDIHTSDLESPSPVKMLPYGRNSLTWRSDHVRHHAEFRSIQAALNRMRFDRSPFIPRSLQEYIQHKEGFATDRLIERRSTLEQMDQDTEIATHDNRNPFSLLTGSEKSFLSNRTRCVALESVWSPLWGPTEQHPRAPWPSTEEAKEEGDERHTSGFGRYLPIPRVPGNDTVAWKQKNFVEMHHMDKVRPVARRYIVDIPGEYEELYEPVEDSEGHIIDDPEEYGRTATVEEFHSCLKAGSSGTISNDIQNCGVIKNTSDTIKHNDFNLSNTLNLALGKSSELNPDAANFAPRGFPGFMSTDDGHAQTEKFDSYSRDHRRNFRSIIAQPNQYELLATNEDSDGASRISKERETGAPCSEMNKDSDESHGMGNTALSLFESKQDIAFELPGYLTEEKKVLQKPSESANMAINTDAHDDQAVNQIFQDYHLPALETISQIVEDSQNNMKRQTAPRAVKLIQYNMTRSESQSGPRMWDKSSGSFPEFEEVTTMTANLGDSKTRDGQEMERRNKELISTLIARDNLPGGTHDTSKDAREKNTEAAHKDHPRRLTYVSELNSSGEWRISSVPLELRTPGSGYRLINQGLNQALLRHMGRGVEREGLWQSQPLSKLESYDQRPDVLERSFPVKVASSSPIQKRIGSKQNRNFKIPNALLAPTKPAAILDVPVKGAVADTSLQRSTSPDIDAGPGPTHEDFTAAGGKTIEYISPGVDVKPEPCSFYSSWLNPGDTNRSSPELEGLLTDREQNYNSNDNYFTKTKSEDEDVVLFQGRRAYGKHLASDYRTEPELQEENYNAMEYEDGGYKNSLNYEHEDQELDCLSLGNYSEVKFMQRYRGQDSGNSGYDAKEYEAADPDDFDSEIDSGEEYASFDT